MLPDVVIKSWHLKMSTWHFHLDFSGEMAPDHYSKTQGGNASTPTWFSPKGHPSEMISIQDYTPLLLIATISVFYTAEFPAKSWGDVLHGGPEQRGGDVQQRISWSGSGGVPSSAGGEGSTQRLFKVPGSAGHQEYVHAQRLQLIFCSFDSFQLSESCIVVCKGIYTDI